VITLTGFSLFVTSLIIYFTNALLLDTLTPPTKKLIEPLITKEMRVRTKLTNVFRRTGTAAIDRETKNAYLPEIKKIKTSQTGAEITLILPDGLSSEDIIKIRPAIAYALNAGELEIYQNGKIIKIVAYNSPLPNYVKFSKPDYSKLKGIIPLLLGESVRGTEIVDLTELPHLLVGGETKGGKSTLLNLIINYLSHNALVDLHVIDFAGVELNYLQAYNIPVADHQGAAIAKINSLKTLWQQRKKLFMAAGTKDIQLYNRRNPTNQLKYNVLIIDELSIFRERPGQEKEEKKILQAAMADLCDLGSIGRKYGIHLILATQKPSADVVPGLLKDNIPASIAFPIKTVFGSMSILGHGGAQHLPRIRGRCIYQYDGERHLQVTHLTEQQKEEHIGYIKKPEKGLIYAVLPDEITS